MTLQRGYLTTFTFIYIYYYNTTVVLFLFVITVLYYTGNEPTLGYI